MAGDGELERKFKQKTLNLCAHEIVAKLGLESRTLTLTKYYQALIEQRARCAELNGFVSEYPDEHVLYVFHALAV